MPRKLLLAAAIATAAIAVVLVVHRPIGPTHPALEDGRLPQLVPLRAFYADASSRWRHRLSPDGEHIAWLESKFFKPALWVRDLDGERSNVFRTSDNVRWFVWSADSRYLLYHADRDGWENDVIVSLDVTQSAAEPRTYDFGSDVKAFIANVPPEGGAGILIAHNGRDRTKFDLYRLNLDTGATQPLDLITDRGVSWSFDRQGDVFARKRTTEGSRWFVEVKEADNWREVARGGLDETFHVLALRDLDDSILAISDLGRDKRALVIRDVRTGNEQLLYSHDDVDVGRITLHPETRDPIMASAYPGRQERTYFDPEIERIVAEIDIPPGASLHLVSATSDFSKSIWEVEGDTTGGNLYLVDSTLGSFELLQEHTIAKRSDAMAPMEPIDIRASDGLTIPAYLTRPLNITDPAPMVILIHGGPVARTRWGYNRMSQWLANRGYAVLDVNYRGSDGYGRAFREAAIGEVSRKMHQDILDARQWAVEKGIADPQRVAVVGGSFGGLKTLTAMTQSPDLFAAGVSINGVTDISTLPIEVPVYWTGMPDWYRKYIGDPDDPDDVEEIRRRSPVYNAEKVKGPLLIIQGSNDVRVVRDQSDRMVEALQAAGKDVQYTLIDGAGHSADSMSWQQTILMFREVERFLARHLGGRADGFDYAVLGAKIIP